MAHTKAAQTVLYVVSSTTRGRNGRKLNAAWLRPYFHKVVSVYPGDVTESEEVMCAPPWPNPLGSLDFMGMAPLKRSLDRFLLFPDRSVLFLHAVKRRLRKSIAGELRDGRTVTVLITTPPHAISIMSLYLRRFFPQIRVVVDWQDLWTFDEAYLLRTPMMLRRRLARLEQRIMHAIDVNLTTNHKAADVLVDQYRVPRSKVTYINHHYDPTDELAISPMSAQVTHHAVNTVRIGFLGTMFKPPKVPGEAIVRAIDEVAGSGIAVELHLFGDPTDAARNAAANMQNQVMTIHDRAPHADALRNISACDFLLIALADLPNCNVIMHGKLPHYLMLKRPILALVPRDSFVAEVIETTGTGTVMADAARWTSDLRDVLTDFLAGDYSFHPDESAIQQFSIEHLIEKWVDLAACGTASE